MKIAIYHELPKGGARRAINEYARNLKKFKNTVDLYIAEDHKNIKEIPFYTKVYFHTFIPKKWTGKNWRVRLYKDTVELTKLYLLNKRIAKLIDRRKYDVVLVSASQFIEAPFIMRFLKTPFVFYAGDPNYRLVYDSLITIPSGLDPFRYAYEKLNRATRKELDKKNISFAKLCLSPSKYIAKGFKETYNKANSVIYYGIDTNFYTPGTIKKTIDIFYIGSYQPTDGYPLLKKSLSLMKIKAKARILAFEDEWISDDKELLRLYQQSKLVVCPARKEGLGLVILEAMACGVPVVAVNEAGHKEVVIDGKTGYLVSRNALLMAQKLDYLLTHPTDLKSMSKNAREEMLAHWSWEVNAKKLETLLKSILVRDKFSG